MLTFAYFIAIKNLLYFVLTHFMFLVLAFVFFLIFLFRVLDLNLDLSFHHLSCYFCTHDNMHNMVDYLQWHA